ncbi:cobalamin biosynthesis protein [Brachyspira pilosicoli]|uniref:cobalamin biosynthesis protein n=1 Tax=Brachyspira pilosicoli TaxID=52584 RepID=UPI0012F48C14|nr:cobalamin biosynthesis protein [Brachyspira pilosicoli]
MQTLLILPISFLLNIFVYRFKIDIFQYIRIPIEKLQYLLKDKVYKNNEILELILGIVISLIILSISFIVPYFLFYFLYKVHFLLGIIIELIAAYIIIGIRKPFEVSSSIYSSIKYTNLNAAKETLKENTNIDVNDINRENIIKKTIEYSSISVGEDYIYTSIFFLLGGLPLCFMYKVLCMLSDISSDNNIAIDENRVKDKYGMFNINFAYYINMIPSIFAFLSYAVGSFLLGHDIKKAFRVFKRDGNDNKARLECAVAGALDIELGGEYFKDSEIYDRILVGDAINKLDSSYIVASNKILIMGAIIALFVLIVLKLLFMLLGIIIF